MFLNARDRSPGDHRIPVWLVLLVVLLLFAVVGVGEYALRTMRTVGTATPRDASIVAAEEAVRQNPDDLDARLSLGFAYEEAGMYPEALAEYDEVIAGDPGMLAARYNRGIVLLELERFDEAEEALLGVLADAPAHLMAAKALGERYVETERYAEALEALAPVVVAYPQYADVQYLAGISAEKLGRSAEARAYYQGALKYSPELAGASEGLARVSGAEVDE